MYKIGYMPFTYKKERKIKQRKWVKNKARKEVLF